MFGDPQVPKRQNRPPLVYPRVQDINLPGICPGSYQHIGREPNSNSHTLMRELKIKRDNLLVVKLNEEKNRLATEKLYSENEKKAENMIFRRKVQDRVAQKIKAFKDSVDARRLKLSEFLYHEEKQAYFATIDLAQKSDSTKLEEMRQRAEEIKAKKEAKRIELLKAKKLQQYSEQSHELKDAISKKILIDSKEAQLMQIRENELKKEREKEIENMWHELTIREIKKKEDREQQELIQEKLNINELVGVWEKQIQGKHLVQAEKNRLRMEDYQELQRLKAEMKDNVDTATEQEKRKKLLYAEELKKQVELNRQIYNQRKALEDNFDMQIYDLARNEIERQENQKQDTQAYLRAEAKMYRKHMDQLRQQREEENQKYEELLQQYRNEIDDQNKEIYCKAWCAKEKLRREVLKEREEQINLKKKIAEDEKIRQEKEDEAVKQIHDTNMCLQKTYIRSERENRLKYSRDLSKQIEYNQLLKRREQEETERMHKNCIEEEEAYRKRVDELTSSLDTGKAHKFRAVLEKQCQCPNQTSF